MRIQILIILNLNFYLTLGKRYPIIPLDTYITTDVVTKASLFLDLLMISNKFERIGFIFIDTEKNIPIARITFTTLLIQNIPSL